MICPPFLQPGDTVSLIAPARFVKPSEMLTALQHLVNWGLYVAEGSNLYERYHQFSGTDEQRRHDLQQALDNPNIKAIFFARGGYGSVRTMQGLSFNQFAKNPKWLVGFSDITALHNMAHNLGVMSIHGPMPFTFPETETDDLLSLKKMLFGKTVEYHFDAHPLNRPGTITSTLTGGNLSMLYSLRGTPIDIKPKNKALFIEDLDEYLYHIDRMMMNLSYSSWFDQLDGLLVGGMSDMHDNTVPFGKKVEEIIADVTANHRFPLAFGLPCGHLKPNFPLLLGDKITCKIDPEGVSLRFQSLKG